MGSAGCGTSGDREQSRAVTATFFSALRSHNGGAACAQLSVALRKSVAQNQSEPSCARAVVKLKSRGVPIRATRVYATSARVDLTDNESVFLGRMRDGWKIDAFGCRPRASGPFDCEEQA